MVELWEQSEPLLDGTSYHLPPYPRVLIVPRSAPWDLTRFVDPYPHIEPETGHDRDHRHGLADLVTQLVARALVRLALLTLAYVSLEALYVVEVQPAPAREGNRKRAPSSPRRHFVLLHPLVAWKYGQPGARRNDEHVSPRPHVRRAHWRVLRDERYAHDPSGSPRRIWVKSAWIGPREWVSEGTLYRVLGLTEYGAVAGPCR